MARRRSRALPPHVLDIEAPQFSLNSPADADASSSDDAAVRVDAAFAAAADAAGLTRAERGVAWRWRRQGFRGAISTVKANRTCLALLEVIVEEVESAPPEVWVRWRNAGGLLNHMLREALGDAGRAGKDNHADPEQTSRRASAPKEGAARRRRTA